jgi:hypothetical protein
MKKSELRQIIREEIENIEKLDDNYLNEANSFSKKHYNAIASILKNASSVDDVRNELANLFEKDNPLFNRDRFITAAGG